MTTVPRLLVLTDRRQAAAAGRDLVETVALAAAAGAPAIVLREKDLGAADRARLAAQLAQITGHCGADLLIASDGRLAAAVGARGVHLAAAEDLERPGPPLVVGRSCHGAREVRRAVAAGTDYVTVSPVAATASKPGYGPALGLDGVASLVAEAGSVPVLALGGVTPAAVPDLCAAGVHGVAVMGAVMRASDPGATVHRLLDRLPEDGR